MNASLPYHRVPVLSLLPRLADPRLREAYSTSSSPQRLYVKRRPCVPRVLLMDPISYAIETPLLYDGKFQTMVDTTSPSPVSMFQGIIPLSGYKPGTGTVPSGELLSKYGHVDFGACGSL